jgi:hypothetical protein
MGTMKELGKDGNKYLPKIPELVAEHGSRGER